MAPKILSVEEAVDLVHLSDTLGFPLGPGQPAGFLHGLARRDDYVDLTLMGALLVDLYEVFLKPNVRYLSGFFGPAERFIRDAGGRVEFVPADFRRFAPILEAQNPRIMCALGSVPDNEGFVSLSLHSGAHTAELKRAGADPKRLLLVETNQGAPQTFGTEQFPHRLHLDEIDVLVQSERPLFVLGDPPPNEVDRAIAEYVASYVHDGSTLQTGIGGIPSTVATLLAERDGGDYGVHSEMFTTGLMKLHQAGKVTNAKKGIFEGFSVTTFAAGTVELYEWLDANHEVRFLPVHVVNSPEVIAANHDMVSINGAISVDLFGQVVADSIGGVQFSGIGGHEDFVASSGLELQDRSLICLPSTATVGGNSMSRIVGQLAPGSVVTTPRHQVDLIVTEFGVAHLRGRTIRERAVAIASIAHPDFRDQLVSIAESI